MRRFRAGIATKLAATAGLGVLLVVGMVFNEQLSSAALINSKIAADRERSFIQEVVAAEASLQRMQAAVRDIRLAVTPEELAKVSDAIDAQAASSLKYLDQAISRATHAENKTRLGEVKKLVEAYGKAATDLRAASADYMELAKKRSLISEQWASQLKEFLVALALSDEKQRREIETALQEADYFFLKARSESWQFVVTGEPVAKMNSARGATNAMQKVTEARELSKEPDVGAAIDRLAASISSFVELLDKSLNLAEQKIAIDRERVLPRAREAGALLTAASDAASKFAEQTNAEVVTAMSGASRIGLFVGVAVTLLLIGSAVFSLFNIARPIRRMGAVLLDLANGNKDVQIPYTGRGDEVGDNARAAETFRDRLLHMETLEAEQKHAEVRAAEQRRADTHKLAVSFEAAVGQIIQVVSSSATELEASAAALTRTADTTQQLSASVAETSMEARSNVQTVASAAEELSASVSEISRQVNESNRIASEAVRQAQHTDGRIKALNNAANRIGDVIQLITEIAEQTNLLALNATIEAARAGESGRGFAVVATEVKALAAQTAKATEEIGQQIKDIQAATQDSVAAIKQIGATIGQVSEISAIIAAAVEEQGAATQEIARNIQEAAQGTTQVATNITEVNRGVAETGAASGEMLRSAEKLANQSNLLKTEVDRFLETVRAA